MLNYSYITIKISELEYLIFPKNYRNLNFKEYVDSKMKERIYNHLFHI